MAGSWRSLVEVAEDIPNKVFFLVMKRIIITLAAFGLIIFGVMSAAMPDAVVASEARQTPLTTIGVACPPGDGALPSAIFVPWYAYLDSEGTGKNCKPVLNGDYVGAASRIGLAIIDTLTRIAGVLALAYVLYGAILYVTSQGDQGAPGRPGPVVVAKETITNAIIGLVIALLAIGIVQFIGGLVRA